MYDIVFNHKKSKVYKAVFNTPEGKEILKDLIQFCNVRQPTHVIGDTHETAFNEGKRRVALRILGFINVNETEISDLVQPQNYNE